MTGFIIGAIMLAIVLFITNKKKGSTNMEKPVNTISIKSDLPLDKAMKAIIKFAQSGGYKVDDFDENKGIIVLSDSASLATNTNGYIYPIYVSKISNPDINIEIGIEKKSLVNKSFLGPMGKKAHENCVNGIRTAIYAES